MQATADNAVRAHVFQRDQAIGALAVVEPGTGNVKAIAQSRPMGRNKRAGETYLNYVVPQKFGDSQCCQAGSTFKVFTLAAALEQGIPLNEVFNAPSSMELQPQRLRQLPRLGAGRPAVHHRQLDLERPDEPVLRHPALGQHVLHAARAGDRHLQALRDGQVDGRRPHQPQRRPQRQRRGAGPVLHPRCRPGQPARDGGGLRHVRRPRPALPLPAGDRDPRLRGQPDPRLRLQLRPGDAAVHRGRGQRRAHAASSTAASPRPRRSTSRPPARPAPPRRASRSGSSATPRSSPPRR